MLNSDVLFEISKRLSFDEVYMLGGLCSVLRKMIRNNGTFWKNLITTILPNPLWNKLTLEISDYVQLAINCKTPWSLVEQNLERELERQYILHRLRLPNNNREALRIFIAIETPGLPAPYDKVILRGELEVDDVELEKLNHNMRARNRLKNSQIQEEEEPDEWRQKYMKKSSDPILPERSSTPPPQIVLTEEQQKRKIQADSDFRNHEKDKVFNIIFQRADGKSFYYWNGEDGKQSNFRIYVIDRLSGGSMDISKIPEFRSLKNIQKCKTILSTEEHNEIYKLIGKHLPKEDQGKIVRKNERNLAPIAEPVAVEPGQWNNMFISAFSRGMLGPKVENFKQWILKVDFHDWFQKLNI
jgi:hypothetical protein